MQNERLTEDDMLIIKKSLEHGYMITHDRIRKLLAEVERLQAYEGTGCLECEDRAAMLREGTW